jgi:glucokinase
VSTGDGTVISVMDIGGTHVSVANVNLEARSVLTGQSFREPLNADASAGEFVSALAGCASRLPARSGSRWAIALPGPFDYQRGIAQYEGVGKFDALRGYDLREALLPRLPGADCISWHNDADAFVLGEWWVGAARGHHSAVGITLGTGVGSGFVRDGVILRRGPGIPPGGRVNMLRFAGRPLEETVSRHALRRAYAQATGQSAAPDVREIARRARRGELAAARVFAQTYRALGTVLAPYLADFDPGVVVVGGSIAASWDLVAEPLRAGLADVSPAQTSRIALEPALHLAEAPLLGAAYLATSSGRGCHAAAGEPSPPAGCTFQPTSSSEGL